MANCLFWYFQKQGWPVDQIRAVAGGYVEMGAAPAEAYQRLALFIRDYAPGLQTKQGIDPELNRCFHLERSEEWRRLVAR